MTTNYYQQIIDISSECYANRNNESLYFENKLNEWKPNGNEFVNAPKNYEDFKQLLPIGRYRKSQLVGLLQLVGKYEHVTRNDKYNPVFISTNSQTMVDMYGSQQNASNRIKLAQNVGLIEKIESKYRFNANKFSYPQMYIWNKKVQQYVKQVCKEEGVEEELRKNVEEDKKERDIQVYTLVQNKQDEAIYRVGKALNLPNLSDDEVHKRLYLTYPFLKKYEQLADEDNESLPPCERIKAKPNIKRNKENTLIKSIGYRMTSGIVSLKEHENEHKDYNGVWRKEYLNEVFPNGYYEYDVKSSIYRITYWLNDGIWLDNDIDLYKEIYGNDFNSKEDRQVFKQFCMSLYFDNPTQIYTHKKNLMAETIDKYGSTSIKNAIERASRLMYKAIGKSYKSEIFVYESCLYMSVVHKMRKMGIKVVQIYDGFYYDKEIDVEKIVKESVKELKEEIEGEKEQERIQVYTLVQNKQDDDLLVDDEFKQELKEQEMEREQERYTSNTLGNSKPRVLSESEFSDFIDEMMRFLV